MSVAHTHSELVPAEASEAIPEARAPGRRRAWTAAPVVQVPVEAIYPNQNPVRRDVGDLSELTASIAAVGVLQPLLIDRDASGRLTIVKGGRRYQAAVDAGRDTVPCIPAAAGDASTQLLIMLAASIHQALTPLEQAEAFDRLSDAGMRAAEIARRTGFAESTVRDRLALLELPAVARRMLEHKEIGVSDAIDLARSARSQRTAARKGSKPSSIEHVPRSSRSAWFTRQHPLAEQVRSMCDHREQRTVVGGTGCGQCWEDAIRTDEYGSAVGGAMKHVS